MGAEWWTDVELVCDGYRAAVSGNRKVPRHMVMMAVHNMNALTLLDRMLKRFG